MSRHETKMRAVAHAAMRPRLLALLVLLAVVASACVLLGNWQLGRAQSRAEAAVQKTIDQENAAGAVDLATVLQPQSTFTGTMLGRLVSVTGELGQDRLMVPGREVDGHPATIVIAPMAVPQADGSTAILPVALGWRAADAAAGHEALGTASETVELTGYLAAGEAPDRTDVGPGAAAAISPAQLLHQWGGPIYTGYLVLTGDAPAQAHLSPLPHPLPPVQGWNLQNLFYALEWWVFGGFALLVWAKVVLDQARVDHPGLWRTSRTASAQALAGEGRG